MDLFSNEIVKKRKSDISISELLAMSVPEDGGSPGTLLRYNSFLASSPLPPYVTKLFSFSSIFLPLTLTFPDLLYSHISAVRLIK